MGVVYKAEDTKLERLVALKFLSGHLLGDQDVRKRFEREAKAAAALDHANVCTVYEIDQADGQTFIAMALIEGESLAKKIAQGPLKVEEALDIARQVAEGLRAARDRGVVHRDIKPENVIVDQVGHVTILDFGLAQLAQASRLTRADQALGTTAYMSPEQTQGAGTDQRTDIWSLGVVLYEMVTGQQPFKGDYSKAVAYSILNEGHEPVTALRTGVPMELERVVDKCLSKDGGDRYQSATELVVDLRSLGAKASDTKSPAALPAPTPSRKRLWAVALGLIVLVAAVAFWVARPDDRERTSESWRTSRVTSTPELELFFSASSNSSLIAYSNNVSGNNDVYVMPVTGGKPLQLTTDPDDDDEPVLSPDGGLVVYHSSQAQGQLYAVPVTGGAPRPLARTNWSGQGFPSAIGANPWRVADGRQELLFSRQHPAGHVSIWKLDIASLEETQVSYPDKGERHFNASYSANRTQIVFGRAVHSRRELWLMPAEGGEARPLVQDEFENRSPCWTPDGRRIVFQSDRSGSRNLWEVTLSTGNLRQITAGPGNDERPLVVEGRGLFYVQSGHALNLFRVDLASGNDEALTTGSNVDRWRPNFSRDGRFLMFDGRQGRDSEVSKFDLDSGETTNLTDNEAEDRYPDWSPVSDEIVFLSDRDGAPALWIMDGAGRSSRRVERQADALPPGIGVGSDAPSGPPRWKPDGNRIGYVGLGENGPELWSVGPDGSDPKRLLEGVSAFDWYDESGRTVVYSTTPTSSRRELRVVNLDTGEEELLGTGAFTGIDVAPDGRSVAFIDMKSHVAQRTSLLPLAPPRAEGGVPRPAGPVQTLTRGEGVWHTHGGSFSPDGSMYIYDHDEDYGDVLLIENYR